MHSVEVPKQGSNSVSSQATSSTASSSYIWVRISPVEAKPISSRSRSRVHTGRARSSSAIHELFFPRMTTLSFSQIHGNRLGLPRLLVDARYPQPAIYPSLTMLVLSSFESEGPICELTSCGIDRRRTPTCSGKNSLPRTGHHSFHKTRVIFC